MVHINLLPPDIICQIISTLPISSIIHCTLVCKLWQTLISNPFLSKHNPIYFVLYNIETNRHTIFDDTPDGQVIQMKLSFPRSDETGLLGTCNGLICVSQWVKKVRSILVCNPIIGESVTVPKPSLPYRDEFYAFGFCPITNHYKLLRFVCNPPTHNLEAEIYTLGSQSQAWRYVGEYARDLFLNASFNPICAGGVVHWLVHKGIGSISTLDFEAEGLGLTPTPESILTFDLEAEEFGSIPSPPIGDARDLYILGCMEGCLVATAGGNPFLGLGMDILDIWVRKKSWSKNFVVHVDSNSLKSLRTLHFLVPIAVSNDARILMISNWNLYSYDPKNGHGSVSALVDRRFCLVPYAATLVSPRVLMEGGSFQNKDTG